MTEQSRQFLHAPHALGDLVRGDTLPNRLARQHVRAPLRAFRQCRGPGEITRAPIVSIAGISVASTWSSSPATASACN